MARGDCQRAFAETAASDGVALVVRQSFDWLCPRGHLALPSEARSAASALERIYLALGGDLDTLATARCNRLQNDLFHEPTGTLIEVDEHQHFTSFRATALDLYPKGVPLGFDPAVYEALCHTWRPKADTYRRAKETRGFGVGGRQRQRAYYDALRDIAAPAMGHPALVRIDAPDRDGQAPTVKSREVV